MRWIFVYLCPPESVDYGAGKNFIARAFQANSMLMSIEAKSITIDPPNSIILGQRSQALLLKF